MIAAATPTLAPIATDSPLAPIPTSSPATPLAARYDPSAPPNLLAAPAKLTARVLAHDIYGDFAFTPDGAWIVYLSHAEGLVAVRPDGKGKRLLSGKSTRVQIAHDRRSPSREDPDDRTREHGDPQAPGYFRFSRDSKTIVYGTYAGQVYSVSISGGTPIQLTASAQQIGSVEITPDGRWVAISPVGGSVTLVPIRGGTPRAFLDAHPLGMMFEITSDGRVVFRGPRHVHIRDLLGGTPRDLTPGLPRTDLYKVIDGAAVVAADRVVYVASLDGSGLVRMDAPVSWPPHAVANGRSFAYHDPQYNLLYVDARTKQPRIVNRPLTGAEQVSPFYASTRTALVYNIISSVKARTGRRNELRVAALDGSFERGLAFVPASSTVVLKTTHDDRRAVVHVKTDAETMAVFSVALDTGKLQRLTPMWPGWSSFAVGARHAIVGVGSDLYVMDVP